MGFRTTGVAMKFRTGLVIGGIAGYVIGTRMARRDEDEAAPRQGVLEAMARHPSARRLSERGRRVIDLAGERGVGALRRARSTIQRRLEASVDDVSMN
jgi:hypothetical protein